MLVEEIIYEKVIILPDQEGYNFAVTKNPTRQQFMRIATNEHLDLKGILAGRDLFYWPAYHAHHGQITNALGIDPYAEHKIDLFLQDKGVLVVQGDHEYVRNHPRLRAIYGSNFHGAAAGND